LYAVNTKISIIEKKESQNMWSHNPVMTVKRKYIKGRDEIVIDTHILPFPEIPG